jgi:hypothetical protein
MGYIPRIQKGLDAKKNREMIKKEDLIRKQRVQKMFLEFKKENPTLTMRDFILKT